MTQRNRGRGRSFRRSGRRQKTSWLQTSAEFVISAGAGAILFLDLTPPPMRDAIGSTEGTATIKRLILHGLFSLLVPNVNLQFAMLGIYVLSHEAFLQTALSDPTSDEGQDWYYWTARSAQAADVGVLLTGDKWDVDIRTARKLRAGYKLVMVINNPLNNVITTMHIATRALWTQDV